MGYRYYSVSRKVSPSKILQQSNTKLNIFLVSKPYVWNRVPRIPSEQPLRTNKTFLLVLSQVLRSFFLDTLELQINAYDAVNSRLWNAWTFLCVVITKQVDAIAENRWMLKIRSRKMNLWIAENEIYRRRKPTSLRIITNQSQNFCVTSHVTTHLILPINFWPLFAYSLYNFYCAAICIKAVYSQKSQCKAFLGRSRKIWSFLTLSSKTVSKL